MKPSLANVITFNPPKTRKIRDDELVKWSEKDEPDKLSYTIADTLIKRGFIDEYLE